MMFKRKCWGNGLTSEFVSGRAWNTVLELYWTFPAQS